MSQEFIDILGCVGEDLLSSTNVVRSKVIQEYGKETNLLNLVAITDGARTIRTAYST